MLAFNSLSRDHSEAAAPAFLKRMWLSTPSLGITNVLHNNTEKNLIFSLSTPSLGITQARFVIGTSTNMATFNSLSRDHIT